MAFCVFSLHIESVSISMCINKSHCDLYNKYWSHRLTLLSATPFQLTPYNTSAEDFEKFGHYCPSYQN